MAKVTFKIWRGDANGGGLAEYQTEVGAGMVVSTPSTRSRPSPPATSPCAGTARRANAAPARPRSTASRA